MSAFKKRTAAFERLINIIEVEIHWYQGGAEDALVRLLSDGAGDLWLLLEDV